MFWFCEVLSYDTTQGQSSELTKAAGSDSLAGIFRTSPMFFPGLLVAWLPVLVWEQGNGGGRYLSATGITSMLGPLASG